MKQACESSSFQLISSFLKIFWCQNVSFFFSFQPIFGIYAVFPCFLPVASHTSVETRHGISSIKTCKHKLQKCQHTFVHKKCLSSGFILRGMVSLWLTSTYQLLMPTDGIPEKLEISCNLVQKLRDKMSLS